MNTTSYSHPDQPVRHTYPLAITTDGFSTALSLCLKTSPYILLRLGILLLFALGTIIWFVICGGLAALFSGKNGEHAGGGLLLFIFAIGVPAGIFAWLRNYVLYVLKLGHVAVLTKLITDGNVPSGKGQIEYGKEIVATRLGEITTLFVLDALITGVVRAFNTTLEWLSNLIPIPGLNNIVQVINAIIRNATTFIDETIFSYNLARADENIWRSSADGLVYYGQNVKPVLKTAVWSLLIEYALIVVLFIICLTPAAFIGYMLPSAVAGFAWVFAIIIAASIRSAVLHPIFLTMVMLTFHLNARGQSIDKSVADKLSSVSGKFQELTEKAKNWIHGSSQKIPS